MLNGIEIPHSIRIYIEFHFFDELAVKCLPCSFAFFDFSAREFVFFRNVLVLALAALGTEHLVVFYQYCAYYIKRFHDFAFAQ